MDRGEPALVPQWLKNNVSSASGGGGGRQSSSLLSGGDSFRGRSNRSLVKQTRSLYSANTGVNASERSTTAYFHRNSGAHPQSYSSFASRSNRNGVHEDPIKLYDKEKLGVGINRGTNHSDHFHSRLQRKFEKGELQHSKTTNGWKDEVARHGNGSSELCNNDTINYRSSGNVLLGSGNGTTKINKPSFEQDFPSLVSEENRVAPETGRVPSPGFQRQLSPTSDRWTSVLAEAPGTNGSGSSSISASSKVASGVSSPFPQSTVVPNMAETVAQIPVRARTHPELSVNTQRLEELTLKKSKQLIPMTPNTPRSHTTISLDKSKTRIVQPHVKASPLLSGSQPLRAGPSRLDAVKSSNLSKLQVLKPSKDLNGVSAAGKESLGSPNGTSVPAGTLSMGLLTSGSPSGISLSHQSLAGLERKPAVVSPILEKKPSLQAQSRNEFFNHLKKKSSSCNSPASNGGHSMSSTLSEKSDSPSAMPITPEMKQEAPRGVENGIVVANLSDGDDCTVTQHPIVNGEEQLFPLNEEEAAFMRSLGWEEGAGEDEEGLTEEEINSFLKRANMGLSSQSLSVQKMALQLTAGLNNCLGFSSERCLSMPHSES